VTGTRGDAVLTGIEVGRMFRVDAKTIARWARCGKLPHFRTAGGHRRYRESDVRRVLAGIWGTELDPRSACERFADWVISLDEPGSVDRRTVTLQQIIERARATREVLRATGDDGVAP